MSASGTGGRGFFRAGAIALIVIGAMHATTHLAPQPPGSELLHEAMLAFTVTALGLTWSVHDAYETLSLSYAWMSVWLGALGLFVLQRLRPEPAALRVLATLCAAGTALLVVISAAYRVAPPLHLYALATALFVVSAVRARA